MLFSAPLRSAFTLSARGLLEDLQEKLRLILEKGVEFLFIDHPEEGPVLQCHRRRGARRGLEQAHLAEKLFLLQDGELSFLLCPVVEIDADAALADLVHAQLHLVLAEDHIARVEAHIFHACASSLWFSIWEAS